MPFIDIEKQLRAALAEIDKQVAELLNERERIVTALDALAGSSPIKVNGRVTQEEARAWARERGSSWWTVSELAENFGVPTSTARGHIRQMAQAGVIEARGKTSDRAFRYAPPPNNAPDERPRGEEQVVATVPRGPAPTGKRPRAARKDVEALLSEAENAGAAISRAGSGHFKIKTREGKTMTVPSTPSDHRSLDNARAQMRRIGINA